MGPRLGKRTNLSRVDAVWCADADAVAEATTAPNTVPRRAETSVEDNAAPRRWAPSSMRFFPEPGNVTRVFDASFASVSAVHGSHRRIHRVVGRGAALIPSSAAAHRSKATLRRGCRREEKKDEGQQRRYRASSRSLLGAPRDRRLGPRRMSLAGTPRRLHRRNHSREGAAAHADQPFLSCRAAVCFGVFFVVLLSARATES